MDLKLKGLRALVAGSSRGLGYAAAGLLAQEGACVALNGRDPEAIQAAARELRSRSGAEVIGLAGDVSLPETAASLVDGVVQDFGGLDILITNSGGPPPGKFDAFDDAAWQHAVELNLLSHVRLIRAALPALRKSEHASVLTITSISVKQPIPDLVLSNSVRAATVGLTKSLALELAPEGIRFNSILPGWTETERVQHLMEARARSRGTSVAEEIVKQAQDSPLGRLGQPEEFASAAVFLVSPVASYITGVMLGVDGGAYKALL